MYSSYWLDDEFGFGLTKSISKRKYILIIYHRAESHHYTQKHFLNTF